MDETSINEPLATKWLLRTKLTANPVLSQIRVPSVNADKIVLSSLHIKLGIMQKFIKKLCEVNQRALNFLCGRLVSVKVHQKHLTMATINFSNKQIS